MEPELPKSTTLNVSLPAELARYARDKVQSGLYASVSEVVREALRRLAAEESRNDRVDRKTVGNALEGMRRLRRTLDARGATLSLDEIRRDIESGRS